jgi:hypothetical protein
MSDLVHIWDSVLKAYWGPNRGGFTTHKVDAGKYERQEAGRLAQRHGKPLLTLVSVKQPKPTELDTLKAEVEKLREALKSTRPYTRPPVRSKLVFNAASDTKETDHD